FLERNRRDIRGRVLEVKDPGYAQAYGSMVECTDVVDIAQDNPSATLISDLSARGSLPEAKYDCFILSKPYTSSTRFTMSSKMATERFGLGACILQRCLA